MTKMLQIRLDPDLADKIKELAQENRRSLNAQINYMLIKSFSKKNDVEKKLDNIIRKIEDIK